jgi:Fic family protein
MNKEDYKNSPTGRLTGIGDGNFAFVPDKLPRAFDIDPEMATILSKADRYLGRLTGIIHNIDNPYFIIRPFTMKEAEVTARIEGTLSTLTELYEFEAGKIEPKKYPKRRYSDIKEVFNFVNAMNYGVDALEKLPISLRLIKEIHFRLLEGVRGESSRVGEFRRTQNWIGTSGTNIEDATYIPPPVSDMNELLDDLEKFLNEVKNIPILIECAVMHYQFEAIHPFNDGNGRIGRLLITLLLYERKVINYPFFYMSYYFNKHKDEYIERLSSISKTGDWINWFKFFLRGVVFQAEDTVNRIEKVISIKEKYRQLVYENTRSSNPLRLIDELFINPIVDIPYVSKRLDISYPSAKNAVKLLMELGFLSELSTSGRKRSFIADKLVRIFED